MKISQLNDLYRQLIIDHAQHPHHHGQLPQADQSVNLNNPTCGDVIDLQVVFKDQQISEVAFSGDGCSISQASASMMCDLVQGQTISQAKQEIAVFLEMLMNNPDEPSDILGDAAVLAAVVKFPARIKCATLAWKALEQAITQEEQHARD
jgi:SUF system FeS assembly protein, NifU family